MLTEVTGLKGTDYFVGIRNEEYGLCPSCGLEATHGGTKEWKAVYVVVRLSENCSPERLLSLVFVLLN